MTPVMHSSLSVYQTGHDLMCQVLRKVLLNGVQAGRSAAGGIGSVECQAVATLYMLLMDHPIDRRVAAGLAGGRERYSGRGGVAAGCTARRVCGCTSPMRRYCCGCWSTS